MTLQTEQRPKKQNNNIDLGLAILCSVAKKHQTITHKDIADVCDCSPQYVSHLERSALAKLKPFAESRGLRAFVSG